jgi:hypothetical protein
MTSGGPVRMGRIRLRRTGWNHPSDHILSAKPILFILTVRLSPLRGSP